MADGVPQAAVAIVPGDQIVVGRQSWLAENSTTVIGALTTVLAAECVAKSFGARRVLTAASLRAVSGETRALVGRNGEGKSTLLKIAAGILRPDGGAVLLDGERRLDHSFASLARAGLFYLPDHGLLSPAFSVRRRASRALRPDAKAWPETPPSRTMMASSRASRVGLPARE